MGYFSRFLLSASPVKTMADQRLYELLQKKVGGLVRNSHRVLDENSLLRRSAKIIRALEKEYEPKRDGPFAFVRLFRPDETSELKRVKENYAYLQSHYIAPVVKSQAAHLLDSPITNNQFDSKALRKMLWAYQTEKGPFLVKDTVVRFIRHHVFLHNSGLNKSPLLYLLDVLHRDKKCRRFLKDLLLDPASVNEGELWASGNHEWLIRKQFVEAILRSCGLTDKDIEPFVYALDNLSYPVYSWLEMAFDLRSPTNYMYFKTSLCGLPLYYIKGGHIPALRRFIPKGDEAKSLKGVATVGSYGFHTALEEGLKKSRKLSDYINHILLVDRRYLLTGREQFLSRLFDSARYSVAGVNVTRNPWGVRTQLQKAKEERDVLFYRHGCYAQWHRLNQEGKEALNEQAGATVSFKAA